MTGLTWAKGQTRCYVLGQGSDAGRVRVYVTYHPTPFSSWDVEVWAWRNRDYETVATQQYGGYTAFEAAVEALVTSPLNWDAVKIGTTDVWTPYEKAAMMLVGAGMPEDYESEDDWWKGEE